VVGPLGQSREGEGGPERDTRGRELPPLTVTTTPADEDAVLDALADYLVSLWAQRRGSARERRPESGPGGRGAA
jgi:hypothetical protein